MPREQHCLSAQSPPQLPNGHVKEPIAIKMLKMSMFHGPNYCATQTVEIDSEGFSRLCCCWEEDVAGGGHSRALSTMPPWQNKKWGENHQPKP